MKIVSICLAILFFILTLGSVYEFFDIPYEWESPLIPHSFVAELQKTYVIYTIVNLVFFLLSLYVSLKRGTLANFKPVCGIVLGYIATIMILSFIIVNG